MRVNRTASWLVLAGLVGVVGAALGCRKAPAPQMVPEVAVQTLQPERVVLTTELPGRTSPFLVAEIRPQVLAAWKLDQARTQLQAQAQTALQQGGLEALKPLGAVVQTLSDTTLSAQPDLENHSAIRQALLDAAPGQTTPFRWTEDGKLWVAVLKARTPPPALTFETRKALVEGIQTQEAQKLLSAELETLLRQGNLHPGFSSLWGHLGGIWKNEAYLKALQASGPGAADSQE